MAKSNKKPIYKRIVLKLSGEALQGDLQFGIDYKVIRSLAERVKKLRELEIKYLGEVKSNDEEATNAKEANGGGKKQKR